MKHERKMKSRFWHFSVKKKKAREISPDLHIID
jgi:hypothetical protein